MEMTLEDRIRQRAYYMWLDGGGGLDSTSYWLTAEREVLADTEREAAAVSPRMDADLDPAAHSLARRVNALVLLESGSGGDAADIGVAAE